MDSAIAGSSWQVAQRTVPTLGVSADKVGIPVTRNAIAQQTKFKETNMNWDQIEGKWRQTKGTMRQKWGKLTDDDLDVIAGRQEELQGENPGAIWNHTGGSREADPRLDFLARGCRFHGAPEGKLAPPSVNAEAMGADDRSWRLPAAAHIQVSGPPVGAVLPHFV